MCSNLQTNSALEQFHTDCLALCEFCRGTHDDTARAVTLLPNFGIVAGENFSVYVHSCHGGHYTRCRATPLRLASPLMHEREQQLLLPKIEGPKHHV